MYIIIGLWFWKCFASLDSIVPIFSWSFLSFFQLSLFERKQPCNIGKSLWNTEVIRCFSIIWGERPLANMLWRVTNVIPLPTWWKNFTFLSMKKIWRKMYAKWFMNCLINQMTPNTKPFLILWTFISHFECFVG